MRKDKIKHLNEMLDSKEDILKYKDYILNIFTKEELKEYRKTILLEKQELFEKIHGR